MELVKEVFPEYAVVEDLKDLPKTLSKILHDEVIRRMRRHGRPRGQGPVRFTSPKRTPRSAPETETGTSDGGKKTEKRIRPEKKFFEEISRYP